MKNTPLVDRIVPPLVPSVQNRLKVLAVGRVPPNSKVPPLSVTFVPAPKVDALPFRATLLTVRMPLLTITGPV